MHSLILRNSSRTLLVTSALLLYKENIPSSFFPCISIVRSVSVQQEYIPSGREAQKKMYKVFAGVIASSRK